MNKIVRKSILDLDPYIPGKPIDEVKREYGIEKVTKLASNESPFAPSAKVIEALKESLDHLNLYPDGNCYELKEALSTYWQIDTNQLIIGNGSDEIITMISQIFINPEDECIIAEPTFSAYESGVKLMGGKCIHVQLKDYTLDLEGMVAAITPKTKIIFICNPNNPTGTLVTQEQLDCFMAKVPDNVLVVFDEAYYEFVLEEQYGKGLKYLKQGRKVIVLHTFSKIYSLAGLRIGYGITSPEIISYIERMRDPFNVNQLAQVAAVASLQDATHIQKSIKNNEAGKTYLYEELSNLGLSYIFTHTSFLLVEVGEKAQEIYIALLERGVITRPGKAFGLPLHLRVSIGSMEENERFVVCLKEVLANL